MQATKRRTIRKSINPGEVDEHAARELYLYATNDSNLYRQQITPINKNLITKKARGIYKTELAIKLAMYLMENAAKKYVREFGSPGDNWHTMFNVPTRREAAKEFVEHFENEAQYGNYDSLLPAKYQKNSARRNSTSTEVRSPTSTETSTEAYTKDNVTVTGGAGAGATTKVTIVNRRNGKATGTVGNSRERGGIQLPDDVIASGYKEVRPFHHEQVFYSPSLNFKGTEKEFIKAGHGYSYTEREKGKRIVKRNATASDFRQHQKIRLQELAAMFQGEASGEKRRVAESDYTPSKKYRLGYLKLLKIKDSGKVIPITVNGDEKGVEAYLAADLKNNLLIVGKDSRIEGIKLPPKGQLKYLGELSQIDYVTSKKHIGGGKLIHFYHKLGEVTGERPNLFVDDDGFPIIQGGSYDIWNVGIVN